jgi:hypothetical protein
MTRPPLKRVAGPVLRGALVLASIALAVYLVADQIYWRRLQERRLAFQARFGAVDFRDFIPDRPAPEADAGRIYQYAAAMLARADRAHGDWSLFHVLLEGPKGFSENTGEQVPLVSAEEAASRAAAKLEALDAVWPVLRHADSKEAGALLHFDPATKRAPELEELRDLARTLAAKAVVEARAGNLDEACRWLESGLHLADLMRDQPTMIALMIRVACLQTSARAFEAVANTTQEPLPLRPAYFEAWDRAADLQWFVRSLASESVFTWSIELPGTWRLQRSRYLLECAAYFEQIVDALETPMTRAPGARGATATDRMRAFSETLTASRVGATPLSAPLEALADVEAAIQSHFTQHPVTSDTVREVVKPPSHAAAAALSLGLIRASQAYFRLPVMRDQIRIAMALRAYHADHGAYPVQLEDLAPNYLESVPEDVISGESFHYQHEDGGVVLKSAMIAVHDVQLRLNTPETRSETP